MKTCRTIKIFIGNYPCENKSIMMNEFRDQGRYFIKHIRRRKWILCNVVNINKTGIIQFLRNRELDIFGKLHKIG